MAERPSYRDFAHSKTPKNLAPADWACSKPDAPYFRDGQMNRASHGSDDSAPPTRSSLGRTVRVEHIHYRADKD